MKKVLFAVLAMVAISFAACTNKAQAPAEEVVDSIAEVVDSVVDSLAADSVVADSAAVAE